MLHWPKKSFVMPFYYINFDQGLHISLTFLRRGSCLTEMERFMKKLFGEAMFDTFHLLVFL